MTTNGDVEEGGDTVGSLPPAPQPRRTLAGIEGVLSSRGFNTGGPSEGGEGGGQAGGDKPANFADYLAAHTPGHTGPQVGLGYRMRGYFDEEPEDFQTQLRTKACRELCPLPPSPRRGHLTCAALRKVTGGEGCG